MKTLQKYHYLAFPILYISILGLMILLGVMNSYLKYGIPAILSIILSPNYTTVQTQSGEKTIVKWLFFEKTFIEK